MELASLSDAYHVRRLGKDDIEPIFDLCRKHELFYRYHPPLVTRESIREDMRMLPPGKDAADKYYVGFFDHEALVAVMDFVLGYPDPDVAFIGSLMVDSACQGQGIGSQIVADCVECWRKLGFRRIRLGVDKGNPQSGSFWKKNGFAMVGENRYIVMEQRL